MDDLDNIRVRLSGKTVQKCVTNYLKNSKQARKAIDDAVGRVIMENALYEKMEKEIVKGCVQKLYENNQAYSFRKEIKDEIIRDILDRIDTKDIINEWLKRKLEV